MLIDYFCEIVIQESEFQVFSPLVLSNSIIFLARQSQNLEHTWDSRMEELTCFTQSQLQPVIDLMNSKFADLIEFAQEVTKEDLIISEPTGRTLAMLLDEKV